MGTCCGSGGTGPEVMLTLYGVQVGPRHREPRSPTRQCCGGRTWLWRDSWVPSGPAAMPSGHALPDLHIGGESACMGGLGALLAHPQGCVVGGLPGAPV